MSQRRWSSHSGPVQLSYPAQNRYTGARSVTWKVFLMAEQVGFEGARAHMVDSQVRPNHVSDERVIAALRHLPREAFAPDATLAYADNDIALGAGRYLLKPVVTARLAQLALSTNPAHVLVIGAGSGYLAAILAASGTQVVALEEEARLQTGALAAYAPCVESVSGKLDAGWPSGGPYDVSVIEGAVRSIPAALAAQVVPGGRVVTVLATTNEDGGIGRAVSAQVAGEGFVVTPEFDATAHLLPQLAPAPEFVF